jgi:hypothetical protein
MSYVMSEACAIQTYPMHASTQYASPVLQLIEHRKVQSSLNRVARAPSTIRPACLPACMHARSRMQSSHCYTRAADGCPPFRPSFLPSPRGWQALAWTQRPPGRCPSLARSSAPQKLHGRCPRSHTVTHSWQLVTLWHAASHGLPLPHQSHPATATDGPSQPPHSISNSKTKNPVLHTPPA